MDQNELHAVSLLLRGASKTLIIIDEKNPATHFIAECLVALITSFHNEAYVITSQPIIHPLITYTTTTDYQTTFTTTLHDVGNILASQTHNSLTLTTSYKPRITTTYPCDAIIILTSQPLTTSKFLKNNPNLLQNIPSIIITNESTINHTATHIINSETKATLAQVCLELLQSLEIEITENIATALLTCLYTETDCIAKPINQKTLTVASTLLEKNAAHERIMKALLRNNSIEELSELGKLYGNIQYSKHNTIAYSLIGSSKKIGKTAAREILTSLPTTHLVVIPDKENQQTYHLWCDSTLSLSNLLYAVEGEIEKEYAHITITEDLLVFINYLQEHIESI